MTSSGPSGIQASPHAIFFAAIETTGMPMIVTDPHRPDNPIIVANRAFVRMTGYQPEELIGRNCRFLQGPDTDRGAAEQVRSAIAERRDCATEILNYRKDGSSFWNALFISPVFDPAGHLLFFFGSQLDVTPRHDAEHALDQAREVERLGRLTGGIAHDFNNLLQVISGYTEILMDAADRPQIDAERMKRAGDVIKEATDRAAKLTHQLLAVHAGRAPKDG